MQRKSKLSKAIEKRNRFISMKYRKAYPNEYMADDGELSEITQREEGTRLVIEGNIRVLQKTMEHKHPGIILRTLIELYESGEFLHFEVNSFNYNFRLECDRFVELRRFLIDQASPKEVLEIQGRWEGRWSKKEDEEPKERRTANFPLIYC